MKYFITTIIFIILANYLSAQSQAEKDSINALFTEEPFIFTFYPDVKLPKMIEQFNSNNCIIPANIRQASFSYSFTFRTLINEDGCCIQYVVTFPKKIPYYLIDYVKCLGEQLNYIHFVPAYKNNYPVKSWVNVPFYINQ